ncbi:MAG: protein kinase [Sandaracinaceae bacterium]|nr:protein kinase [Sandaracinaceae bacterium]
MGSSAETKVGELVDGKYELEALLGKGGMGAVYRARHAVTGRRVAIKWLLEDDEERRRRFLREARAMGRLSHPNVAQIFDVCEHEGEIFLVMEYLEGGSLRDFIPPGGMPPDEAIGLLLPAFQGVAAAHQAGILHRDLKPENLFVCCDRDGTPYDMKVLDFGLAKAAEAQADSKLTHSGSIVGTPRYMSPEQLEEKDVDERADVFALGLILYECLLGDLPYRSQSLNALLLEILTADHPSPTELKDEIPEELGAIVKKAIERAPENRFASVIELAQAIEPFTKANFQVPRQVHLAEIDDRSGGLTPRMDDERISSTIRARPSSPSGSGAVTEDGPLRPQGERSERAFAPTAALSGDDVAASLAGTDRIAAPARKSWVVPASIGVVALIVVGAVASLFLGGEDPTAIVPPNAPAAIAEPAAVEPTPEVPAVPEVPEVVQTPEPPPVAVEAPEPEEPAVEAPPSEPVAAEPTHHGRRRRSTSTEETAPANPPAGEPDLRINSRAGVLRADDF